jgi:aspartate aminotransferase/aminotransferase
MRDAYRIRRDEVLRLIKAIGCYEYSPRGAFYLLLDVSPLGTNSHLVARSLLEETKVATAPGITFGSMTKDYVRISLASELDDLLEGTTRICRFVYGQ